MSTLTDQLSATKAGAATQLPPEVAGAFTAQQDGLAAQPVPTIPPGTVVPDVPLLTATGETTSVADVVGGSASVLFFYRGGWCPYCNVVLRTYQTELLPQIHGLGVKLVGVSPQRPDQSLSTREKAELAFDVVSDTDNALAGALGIIDEGTATVRAAQAGLGLDLSQVNEHGDVRLPMPTVVVVDADRRVVWADVHPDYTTRTEVSDILDAVRRA